MRISKATYSTTSLEAIIALLVLTIVLTFDLFEFTGAQNVSNSNDTNSKPAGRQHEEDNDEMHCYVCRSDRDSHCRMDVKDSIELVKKCTGEVLNEFTDILKNSTLVHPTNLYSKNKARADTEGKEWSCYQAFSTDGLLVLRTCVSYTNPDPPCGQCKLTTTTGVVTARCCTCDQPYCNDKNSMAPLSIHHLDKIAFLNVFIVLRVMQLFINT